MKPFAILVAGFGVIIGVLVALALTVGSCKSLPAEVNRFSVVLCYVDIILYYSILYLILNVKFFDFLIFF